MSLHTLVAHVHLGREAYWNAMPPFVKLRTKQVGMTYYYSLEYSGKPHLINQNQD